jgi:hypothetical protein
MGTLEENRTSRSSDRLGEYGRDIFRQIQAAKFAVIGRKFSRIRRCPAWQT